MNEHIRIHKENYTGLPKRFTAKLESDIEILLQSNIPALKGIYLFGSCARGEARSSSDLDLLVLTEEKIEDRMLVSSLRCTLDEAIDGVRTDVVFMNAESIKENTVFKNLVNRDKKMIAEVIK